MPDLNSTQYFKVNNETEIAVKDILEAVYIALTEKGYNPVSQIVGYIMSGDPTYVTSYKNARYLIMKVERDELLEELLKELDEIDPDGRRIAELLMDGETDRNIATILGMARSSFSDRKLRIRKELKKRLQKFF